MKVLAVTCCTECPMLKNHSMDADGPFLAHEFYVCGYTRMGTMEIKPHFIHEKRIPLWCGLQTVTLQWARKVVMG